MIKIPEPGDQGHERPEALAEPGPGSSSQARKTQIEASEVPALPQEQAPAGEQPSSPLSLPIDEVESADDEDQREKQAPEKLEQEEAARQKERLDEQARWQEDASSQEQRRIKQRENEHFIEFGKQKISLKRLEPSDFQEVNRLFVEPEGYKEFEQRIRQSTGKHILIIAGQEHSGKLWTALYLASHLWPQKELEFFQFVDRSNKTLLEIISDEKLPGNAVILFDEVFTTGQIKLDELTGPFAHPNEDLANLTNVWFIFTVPDGPVLDVLQAKHFPILSTAGVNCRQVLEKLIDFYFPEDFSFGNERAELLAIRENLNPQLTSSALGKLFETRLHDLKALIDALTRKEEVEQTPPHIWFHNLKPMNYQLYALLVVLFDKLDIPTLEEIYTEAVNALRRQGMDGPDEFIDPRRIGTNLMHDKLGIRVSLNVLEFRSRIYRQYVEAQVANFQRLLWSLIDPDDPSTFTGLIGVIHRLSEYDLELASYAVRDDRYIASSDQLRQLRYAIAVMIAQVGVYHLPKLDLLLGKLVRDESALVSLTAAFVLAEIARRGEHFDFIEKLLKVWCQSGRIELMWAGAASIAYIYEAIARTLEDELAPLTEEDEQDEEREEERKAALSQDQKQLGRGYLARLRDILTELVKMHDSFSEEAIQEARRAIYGAYRKRLRQQFEAASEPVTDNARLFRDLGEIEQEQYLNFVFTDNKRTIDEAVKRDINVLTNSWKNQMRMVLVQSLEHIAQMWPRDITRLVRVWLDRKDTESPLWQIGHMALNYLFQESAAIKDASLLERAAYPLLDLLALALRTHTLTVGAFLHDMNLFLQVEALEDSGTLGQHLEVGNLLRNDSLIYVLYALQRWYENLSRLPVQQENRADGRLAKEDEEEEEEGETQSGAEENVLQKRWQQRVYAVLLNAMNSAAQEERQRLRQVLFLWIKSGERMLNLIARILISHSYVMDGIVLDLPDSKRAGIVVIDSNRRAREDLERIFYLLQNLSAITPVHLHWLGYTRHSRLLSSDNRDESANPRADERITSFVLDDLLLRGTSRPSLLLPIMTSGQGDGYLPEQSYFVAVFHTEPILDLAELFQGASSPPEERKGNIFREYLQRQKAASQSLRQPWQGKVYLLPSTAELTVQAPLSAFLTVVGPESMGMLEEDLRRRVAITLRSCPPEELWRDLRAYIGIPESQPRSFASLALEIERWLEQLSDTSVLYPDVSLFILWTIMLRSRENLPEALQLIERMLQEKAEESEDKAAKKARKLRQQMGIACTRMLFHFYGVDNPILAAEDYGVLLDLLPHVMACASSYTEILPILSVLFELATVSDWLRLLDENEGAFFECISKIAARDLAPLRNWLKYYQRWLAMSRLFLEFNRSFSDFRGFSEDVWHRYRAPQSKKPAGGETPPGEMVSKFLAILPAVDAEEDQGRYTWALRQIELQQARLHDPDARSATLAGLHNLEVLLNHLVSELQASLDGTIERLKQGEYYGIVMVEAQNKNAIHQAFLFLQEFVRQRRQSKGQHITLMLQRLGEKEILAKVRNNRKIKNEREISDKRKLPQVIGPLLERYPAEQVAFVLLITDAPIIDYDDWAEQDQWAPRLWVARLGKWYPYRGEMVALGESTQLTLETLLKRSGGGIENHDHVSLLPDHARAAANQSVQ